MGFFSDLSNSLGLDDVFGSGGYLDDFFGQVDEALFSGPSSTKGSGGGEVTENLDINALPQNFLSQTGEAALDTILRLVQQQLLSARTRAQEVGATDEDFAAALRPLEEQLGAIDRSSGLLEGLTGKLEASALGSTASASAAAANAARLSGSGRFGAGGRAAILASRGAADAAVGQSAALSQAVVQGELAKASHETNLLQQRGGISTALAQVLSNQSGIREERANRRTDLETQFAAILAGFSDVFGGIEQARQNRKSDRDVALINLGSSALQSSSNIQF